MSRYLETGAPRNLGECGSSVSGIGRRHTRLGRRARSRSERPGPVGRSLAGASLWSGSTASVGVNGATGTFTPGAATWTGSPASIGVAGTSGLIVEGSDLDRLGSDGRCRRGVGLVHGRADHLDGLERFDWCRRGHRVVPRRVHLGGLSGIGRRCRDLGELPPRHHRVDRLGVLRLELPVPLGSLCQTRLRGRARPPRSASPVHRRPSSPARPPGRARRRAWVSPVPLVRSPLAHLYGRARTPASVWRGLRGATSAVRPTWIGSEASVGVAGTSAPFLPGAFTWSGSEAGVGSRAVRLVVGGQRTAALARLTHLDRYRRTGRDLLRHGPDLGGLGSGDRHDREPRAASFIGGPTTWVGSGASVGVAGASSLFLPGTINWTGSPASVGVSGTSASSSPALPSGWARRPVSAWPVPSAVFLPGAVTWSGSPASIGMAGTSAPFLPGPTIWVGSSGGIGYPRSVRHVDLGGHLGRQPGRHLCRSCRHADVEGGPDVARRARWAGSGSPALSGVFYTKGIVAMWSDEMDTWSRSCRSSGVPSP